VKCSGPVSQRTILGENIRLPEGLPSVRTCNTEHRTLLSCPYECWHQTTGRPLIRTPCITDLSPQVGVHIADVSHFIRPGTALDREAASRATTVYLIDRRIDMVPELLSSNLCSLRGNETRWVWWQCSFFLIVESLQSHVNIK
jgi:hypothetical protein